ncbi:MAG TPA: FlgD immunoglobulin-like domain containing protein [Candidatus Krumholzibacteria bacterium]|nr:FlgD immunoglobulin-like domain containing protein [Candidatus Krumholzibacteria bacterium]
MTIRTVAMHLLLLLLTAAAGAAPLGPTQAPDRLQPARTGLIAATGPAVAKTDTLLLLGGPGTVDGRFEQPGNPYLPAWNGWTHQDDSVGQPVWQTTVDLSPTGSQAAWLGKLFPSCGGGDPLYGYGNAWLTSLVWEGDVANPSLATHLSVSYVLQHDTEPGFDELTFEVQRGGEWVVEDVYSGLSAGVLFETQTVTLAPGEADGATVRMRLQFRSDGGFSDEDCLWPTNAGAFQLDDFAVSGDNGIAATLDDFSAGMEGGALRIEATGGKGDFAKIWSFLSDADPCFSNDSAAVAFIDDGVVVPCTGGTMATTWTYGPGGYAVNVDGGCGGPYDFYGIDTTVVSPVLALDPVRRGLLLEYDAYLHLPAANNLFHTVKVRCSNDGGLTWSRWRTDGLLIYDDRADWRRRSVRLDGLVDPATTHIQVGLGVAEYEYDPSAVPDPTPAPYLDNVALRAFAVTGPLITVHEAWLARDAFPASGVVDPQDPGANDVRVDSSDPARSDLLLCRVQPLRPGAALTGPPVLHYLLRPNAAFDPYRAHPTGGTVAAVASGKWWTFSLPDTDFLYPGDVMHYYLEASDTDGVTVETSTLPADLTAFGAFPSPVDGASLDWDPRFTMRALPGDLDGGSLLIWDDGLGADGLAALGDDLLDVCAGFGLRGVDLFRTLADGAFDESGLPGHATAAQLASYDAVLYLSGRRHETLLDWDLPTLADYLDQGGRLLAFSENLAQDLAGRGTPAATAFLAARLGVSLTAPFVVPEIGGQYAPELLTVSGQSVISDHARVLYGGCIQVTDADAVAPLPGTVPLLEWSDGLGVPVPGLAAAVLREGAGGGAVVYAPWPLKSLYWSQMAPPPLPPANVRMALLNDLLIWAGASPLGCSDAVEDDIAPVFATGAHPNPFNPEVVLSFTAPRDVRAVVEIYDVRGAKVRTLLDARVDAGPHTATWDGRDDGGAARASGVYFARVRVGEETKVEKLALIR